MLDQLKLYKEFSQEWKDIINDVHNYKEIGRIFYIELFYIQIFDKYFGLRFGFTNAINDYKR